MNDIASISARVRVRWARMAWIMFWGIAAIVLMTVSGASQRSAEAQTTDVGHRGPSFAASGVDKPTRDKPQSKLWFNDGIWWGSLFDKSSEEFRIHRYDTASHTWSDTGTTIDERNNSMADTLWDGNHLYVASAGPRRTNAADSGRFLRYSYDATSKSYTLDEGFPVAVTEGGMEAIVLEKDTTGQFWITYTKGSNVLVNHSLSGDRTWGDPYVLPVAGANNVTSDDISAVVAFDSKVGVMWSNQTNEAMYFATHSDGAPDGAWQLQTANEGPGIADDHINLKSLQSDASGQVFAAVKTEMDKTGRPDAPQIFLMVRGLDGEWTNHVFGRVRDAHTRPVVMIDQENRNLYLIATAPTGGGTIYHKKTPLDDISFAGGRGDPFIQSGADPNVNDATSTKQNLNSETGLLGLAADDTTGYYLHNYLDLRESADTTPPETAIDSGPEGVADTDLASFTFSSSEAGSTFECSLDGAAFEECSSPKDYPGLADGDHTFSVRAIDVSGNVDSTPASRAWTVDTQVPEVPEGPVVQPPTEKFITNSTFATSTIPVKLNWSATDDDGISGYELQQSKNGGAYTNVKLASITTANRLLHLSPGDIYKFRVRATDGLGNVSDWSEGPEFAVDAHQETSGAISYGGAWTQQALSSASGGGLKYAGAKGAAAKFTFTGRDVAWVAPRDVNRGKAEIWLDGAKVTTLSLYSSASQPRMVSFDKSWETSATRTLEVRVLGTKVRQSKGTRVDVDAFVVLR